MNIPYQTAHEALALTLVSCGAQHPVSESGKIVPCYNIYTRDTLIRYGYKGWTMRLAAEDAWKKGKPGTVIYQFINDDICREILKAWDEQTKAMAEALREATTEREYSSASFVLPHLSPADAARICCQWIKNRKVFHDLWKQTVPLIALYGSLKTKDLEASAGYVQSGNFKAISINASQEIRERIGL